MLRFLPPQTPASHPHGLKWGHPQPDHGRHSWETFLCLPPPTGLQTEQTLVFRHRELRLGQTAFPTATAGAGTSETWTVSALASFCGWFSKPRENSKLLLFVQKPFTYQNILLIYPLFSNYSQCLSLFFKDTCSPTSQSHLLLIVRVPSKPSPSPKEHGIRPRPAS